MISREDAEAVCKWLELPRSVRSVVDPDWYAYCLREGINLEDTLTPFQKLSIAWDDFVDVVSSELPSREVMALCLVLLFVALVVLAGSSASRDHATPVSFPAAR